MILEKDVHIFFMEDRAQIRRVYTRICGSRFAEVIIVDTCEALVAAFLEKKSTIGLSHNLVFLDMEIYGERFCGLRALDELKKIDPNVRAILCSSSDHEAMFNPAQYGFKASLEKPFSKEQFNEAIRSVFGQ